MKHRFLHTDEHTWISVEPRDGLTWYRIERLKRDAVLVNDRAEPDDVELLGFARWEPGRTTALDHLGEPGDERLENMLTVRLDSAREAGVIS